MDTLYIVIIVVFIIILLWLICPSTKSRCLSELNGFWVADDDFCQNAGIDLMTVFFGDYQSENPKKNCRTYLCWILIINSSGQFNHITTVDVNTSGQHIKGDQYEFDLEFQDVPMDKSTPIFPTNLKMQVVPGELLTLINPDDDSKVFEGTKNEQATKAIEFNIENSDSE